MSISALTGRVAGSSVDFNPGPDMRRHRSLLRIWRERRLSPQERDAAEALRREREAGRLRNRAETAQAESRRDSWSQFGSGGG
jgi:hypothetical protein